MTKKQGDVLRKKLIAKVKIAQQQLGLDDETYRDLLEQAVDKRSASQMSIEELEIVLVLMQEHGFQASGKWGRKPSVTANKQPLLDKIEALLADGKKPWRYAEAMSERMFNRKQVQWLNMNQLHKLVAALQIHANRQEKADA
ncbi:gp16 family protein [Vitreoscilla stercoraria]|uniref:Regulatory protein GemA n=1 Tax=Vitreoscilla stercoraria TaxID=61 RepID=A0ABY4EF93_VITST|nr:regulatory protein GemA [Vitreoscilla stercoraria]UOO93600.1 regulatory protein GemA [Vitreoscilla stercoraria]